MISICLTMLIFSGCTKSGTNGVIPVLKNFSCSFSIEDSDLSGELTVDDYGKCIFTFDSPIELAGTVITVTENDIFVEADGFTKKFDTDSLPEYNFTLGVFNALNSANETHLQSDGDLVYIDSIGNSGNYVIYFLHSGIIDSINLADNETKINFTNVVKQ